MPVADAQQIDEPQGSGGRRLWPRRWRTRIAAGIAAVAIVGGSASWIDRNRIVRDIVDDYLAESGVAANYDIISIAPHRQVIENLVVGNPARPDFTARRMVIETGIGWAGPELRRVSVEGARVYATYTGGKLSLGALDPLIFTDSEEPPALPAIDLVLRDARALLLSDYGAVGVKLEGAGRLDDGFAGTLAASAPGAGIDGCRAEEATLYGTLTTKNGAPRLDGPLRLAGLDCGGAVLARADIGTRLTLRRDFAGAEGDFALTGAGLSYAALTSQTLSGTGRVTWSGEGLVAAHDLALAGIAAPQGTLARLTSEGTWRGSSDAARGQWQGNLRGTGLSADAALGPALAAAQDSAQGTLIAPLIAKARGGLAAALSGAAFEAEAIIRHKGEGVSLVIPAAQLASRRGERVLALSQVSAGIAASGLTGLRGNVLAGGAGLPNINGRMEQGADGSWSLRLAMAEYSSGANQLAIPRLAVRQAPGGTLRFEGLVSASGDLPGGAVSGLDVPMEGSWSAARGLALGTRCTAVRFRSLALSGLALPGQGLTLCPQDGAPLLAYRDSLRIAASTGPLTLTGTLGESPARFAADKVLLRYPEPFAVEGLTARIGAGGSEARLSAATLTGSLSGDIGGAFAGGAAQLEAVPLDLGALAGRWSFAEGVLRVEEGVFTLTDRPPEGGARFNPLAARGAVLTLADNAITARASLRHPGSDRLVAEVDIVHDLGTAVGSARLGVPGVAFDQRLQPEDLTYLAKGVIAFADGTVSGTGRIDWRGEDITSSGTFASDGLDFAAAFGPVRGLKGEVRFTDLINLTTAPDQRLAIAAINPGIEVLAGTVQFELRDATLLSLEDARFPFMGGELRMRPLAMDFGQPEERRYVFEIIGLDAATFVTQMELTNLGATGTFDGTVPIIFDADGNGRIEQGLLLSRAGGGNVAYIGELTYEDLGAMGNYAFSALRSLDYRQMSIGLNGNLAGEIITNFDFDGVRQGAGTSQNFITRRLAKLPIRFKVNVRSENFYELATMVRSFWDADFLGNPVDKGLLKAENGRFVPAAPQKPVQPPESESQP
ncbi:MAG: YdbH domain-containing protein [Erythrobacter sp.]|nr:YdbH domain-containing protein [Erythrobacter sp.]